MLTHIFHRCNPKLVAVNDEYHTTFKDSNRTEHHQMRFYRCGCGKRSFKSDYKYKYSTHSGIEKSKQNWIDTGVVPEKSYRPEDSKHFVKIDELEKEKLDPVLAYQKTLEDINKSLAVVLNRDFNLESKYPELKKAADEYHRRLEKYKNFEHLKEKK